MGDKAESDDIFGDVEGEEKIDRGWLTTESIVQLKFFNSPFALKQRMKSRLLYIKVSSRITRKPFPLLQYIKNFVTGNTNESSYTYIG